MLLGLAIIELGQNVDEHPGCPLLPENRLTRVTVTAKVSQGIAALAGVVLHDPVLRQNEWRVCRSERAGQGR